MQQRKTLIHVALAALLVTACGQETREDRARAIPAELEESAASTGQEITIAAPEQSREPAVESAVAPLAAPGNKRLAQRAAADMAIAYSAAGVMPHYHHAPAVDRENYLHYPDNGVKQTAQEPLSTFSVDVDTAGYANLRRILAVEGRLPPSDAIRLEEMINYFSYDYTAPDSVAQPFSINTEIAPSPWSDNRHLLQIGLKGFEPPAEERPAANLVFLVDVSGSMRSANKLPLVKKSLRLLVNRMSADDRIALAVYAGAAGTVLESTAGDQKAKIVAAIDALEAGGSTHGSEGIRLAYSLAKQHFIEDGINRVVIASDGDMNVGTVSIEALKDLVQRKRESGIALTTLGFGAGNYNYALMEQLADVGNGNAAYIDNLKEAQKVLVTELQSTLLTIASDVKIQVEFNPAAITEYRLIGYENRVLEREDFNNDRVDAGDIGAGHTVTALYEVVLAGSGGEHIPALRYGANKARLREHGAELAHIKLRYKNPRQKKSILLTRTVQRSELKDSLDAGSPDLRFAASVAGFGQLLRGGEYTGSWNYGDALALARGARGSDASGYRSELVHLIELAQSLTSGS